jgi:ABC-type uncharacterized transport system substrate-binding protein
LKSCLDCGTRQTHTLHFLLHPQLLSIIAMEQKFDDVVTEDIIEEEDAEENKEPEEWQKETDVIKGFPSEEQGMLIV